MYEPVRHELKIANETRYLASVREAVRDVVECSGFPADQLNKLTLAVDESVTNVMEHAYEDDLEGELFIEIVLEASPDSFSAVIRDHGKRFDPTTVPVPNLRSHVDEGRRHGLGIFLMKQIMDEVTYTSFPEGHNELRLVKRIDSAGEEACDSRAAGAQASEA
jgi:serine/threonine-protein kinase RsbW